MSILFFVVLAAALVVALARLTGTPQRVPVRARVEQARELVRRWDHRG